MSQSIRRRRGWVVAGLLVLSAFGGVWRASAQEPAGGNTTASAALVISVGTNRRSELEPCGCAKNQQGGIDREAKLYADVEAKGIPILKLDGGGVVDMAITPHERLKTRYMFEAMHATGYHAINVTSNDALYGFAALRDEASTLSLLSANVRESGKPALPFAPFRVFEVTTAGGKPVRVGVVGISGSAQNAVKTRPTHTNGLQTTKGDNLSTRLIVPARPFQVFATQDGGAPSPAAPAAPIDPAQTRLIDTDTEGGFEPSSTDDYLYLWARTIPMPRLPRAAERVPKYNDFDYLDWFMRKTREEQGTSVTAETLRHVQNTPPLYFTPGTFNFRGEYETSFELPAIAVPTDSQGTLPPSPAGDATGGSVSPSADASAPATTPGHSSVWQRGSAMTAMHWHSGPAKGDTGAAAASVVEITLSDPAVVAAVERARVAVEAMPTLESYERDGTSVDIIDPASALAATMKEVEPVTDFVILLAHMTEREAEPVVAGIGGIDAMVTMEVTSAAEQLHKVGGIDTYRVSYEGRMVGMLELHEDAAGGWTRNLSMAVVKSDAPKVAAISEIIETYKGEVRRTGLGPAKPSTIPDPHVAPTNLEVLFVGAKSCLECHEAEYHQWESTPHAKAIDTLIASNSEYNPDCISCHVTGNQKRGGFINMTQTPVMANVQCEVCHGPGWKHVNSMRLSRYYKNTGRPEKAERVASDANASIHRAVNEALCIECHQPKTGEFVFAERLPFADHSQHYPEERRSRVNNAVDMMEAFGSQKAGAAVPEIGDAPGTGRVEGNLHGSPKRTDHAFARIIPEPAAGSATE